MWWLDEFDGEEELNGADEKTTKIERQSDRAQRQRHLVQDDVLRRRQKLKLIFRRLLVRRRRNFQQKDERQKCEEKRDETKETERRDHSLNSGFSRHVHELGHVGGQRRAQLLSGQIGDVQAAVRDDRRVVPDSPILCGVTSVWNFKLIMIRMIAQLSTFKDY